MQLTAELGLSDWVVFHGGKEHEDVLKIMADSHILLAPSVTAGDGDKEGLPVCIMEAMAMGVPVISTLHSGIPELVVEQETGLLVPERNVTLLAKRIGWLIDNPEEWETLVGGARLAVEQEHDQHKLADQLEEMLLGLAGGRYDA